MIIMLVVEEEVYAHYACRVDGEICVEPIRCDAPAQAVREMIALYDSIPTQQMAGCRRRGEGRRPKTWRGRVRPWN
jgi:hypothetical protein